MSIFNFVTVHKLRTRILQKKIYYIDSDILPLIIDYSDILPLIIDYSDKERKKEKDRAVDKREREREKKGAGANPPPPRIGG